MDEIEDKFSVGKIVMNNDKKRWERRKPWVRPRKKKKKLGNRSGERLSNGSFHFFPNRCAALFLSLFFLALSPQLSRHFYTFILSPSFTLILPLIILSLLDERKKKIGLSRKKKALRLDKID